MEIPGFVPEDLRQLLRFVPTRGWDAVAWRPMLASLRALSWRYVSGRGVTRLSRSLSPRLDGITLGRPDEGALRLDALDDENHRQAAGDRILQLYFQQWLNEQGQFIDLRPVHFRYGDDRLFFTPNGLWLEVGADFREGLVDLYRAFYGGSDTALEAALQRMGMLRPDLDEDAKERLKGLLRGHFGIDQQAARSGRSTAARPTGVVRPCDTV